MEAAELSSVDELKVENALVHEHAENFSESSQATS